MVKDFFGRELKLNDLVVSKATGRHSSMSCGIIIENESIFYESGTIGGAKDTCLITTDIDPMLEQRRLDIIQKRIDLIKQREQIKIENQINRIKQKDFKRFGVYNTEGYDNEIFLDKCFIKGVLLKNVWLSLYKENYKEPLSINNMKVDVVSTWNRNLFRVVKNPRKVNEIFLLTKEQVQKLLNDQWDKLDSMSNYYRTKPEKYWIKLED